MSVHAAPRPKRRCVQETEARRAYVCETERSEEPESERSESEESDSEFDDRGGSDSDPDPDSEIDEDEEREKDGASKVKREHCKGLAECLGIGLLEMQRGARTLVALSHLGDSGVSRFLDAVLSRYTGPSLSKAVRPLIAEVDRRAEVARIYWASPVVDSLAAVFGGDAVRIFKDLASWTTGTKVYIALRLCRTMAAGGKFADVSIAADVMNSDSEADVTNTALLGPSGPEENSVQLPSLRSLAAARFLEFVVASIRGEVDPTTAEITQMQVAGTILRELAPLSGPGLDDLDGLNGTIGLSNKRTAPRPRPVDSTLPKGFPGTCGPGNHAITYKPMLLLEIKRGKDKRLASIVSNEAYGAYGSGPISMFTAAQEIRRLLLLGPLTKLAWREVPEDETVLLSASVRYFPYKADDGTIVKSPGCAVHFGCSIKYISFVKSHLLYALERPDIARILFSPNYHHSRKGSSFALIKITLGIFPPASQRCAQLALLRRKGQVSTLDYVREMVESAESQRQGQACRPRRFRFFEGQVLFR